MVNSKMSDLGETISHDSNDSLEACLGDGAVKAGMISGILPATGKAVAVDGDSATAGISFVGIADRHPTVDFDTVITDAIPMELIKPKSGKKYSVFIEDPGADIPKGTPLTFGQTTAGSLKKVATKAATGNLTPSIDLTGNAQVIVIEPILAYTATKVLNGATAAIVEWK